MQPYIIKNHIHCHQNRHPQFSVITTIIIADMSYATEQQIRPNEIAKQHTRGDKVGGRHR